MSGLSREVPLQPAQSALLIIDTQNFCAHPEGAEFRHLSPADEQLLARLRRVQSVARHETGDVRNVEDQGHRTVAEDRSTSNVLHVLQEAAEALARERFETIQAMDRMVAERDRTIEAQEKMVLERWDAMQEMRRCGSDRTPLLPEAPSRR